MINPSASGWIRKYFSEIKANQASKIFSEKKIYKKIRQSGFIYGHPLQLSFAKNLETKHWNQEELTKIALLDNLHLVFVQHANLYNEKIFIEKITNFYSSIGKITHRKESELTKNYTILENILDERVQTNNNIISKSFSHVITNVFLFIDVLAFKKFLLDEFISDKYLKELELIVLQLFFFCKSRKNNPTKYDDLISKLFESSVRYNKFNQNAIYDLEAIGIHKYKHIYEKLYLLDVTSMAMWSDGMIEKEECLFMMDVAKILEVKKKYCYRSINHLHQYLIENKDVIPYFNYKNPVKHFYDQSTQTVQFLINRNKKRLLKEISQSSELVVLLAQSTIRDLNDKEKKMVKNQLLDICKTIPSLTIFLLPGGSLLLPILIKFIPKILPSAFNENLDQD